MRNDLDSIRFDGKFPRYAWPGGHPLYYLDKDNSVLCAKCANESDSEEEVPNFRPVSYAIHWEGEPMFCDGCGAEIESAYGDPYEEANQ